MKKKTLSEKEKMLQGLPYNASNPRLVLERDRAARILNRYNRRTFHETNMRSRTLRKLLNTSGNFWIKPPFHCDYGYNIFIGKDLLCNYGCVMLDVCKITIGDNVLLGPGVKLFTAAHAINPIERKNGVEFGKPITIHNNVWIGGGSIVLPGVEIGENSIIGAGSVVSKSIPANVVAVG
ncbi:sugar O-acetyltransferase, partial [Breznakia sp. OttesenSCG-928-G09]|nr:sugar O-acetyltransferase [Breznakia sp. OttesenSCG-928-G09]